MSKWKWCYSIIFNAAVILYTIALAWWVCETAGVRGYVHWGIVFVTAPFFLALFEVHRYALPNKLDLFIYRTMLLIASLCVILLGYRATAVAFADFDLRGAVFSIFTTIAVLVFTVVTVARKGVSPSPVAMIVLPVLYLSLAAALVMAKSPWIPVFVAVLWSITLAVYAFFSSRREKFEAIVGAMPFVMFVGLFILGFLVLLASIAASNIT